MANIGIEVLGVIINQVAKRDATKFKGVSAKEMSNDAEKHADGDSDTKPLLSSSEDTKPTDDISSQFDKLSDELDGQLQETKPKFSQS